VSHFLTESKNDHKFQLSGGMFMHPSFTKIIFVNGGSSHEKLKVDYFLLTGTWWKKIQDI
jgi:hypothetical protein